MVYLMDLVESTIRRQTRRTPEIKARKHLSRDNIETNNFLSDTVADYLLQRHLNKNFKFTKDCNSNNGCLVYKITKESFYT